MEKNLFISEKIIFFVCIFCGLIIVVSICFGIYQNNKNNIEFTIEDMLSNGNGKSAKVILLAGQSNASGCSLDEYLKRNVTNEKYSEYASGYDNIFINYYTSGKNISNGFVKTAPHQGETEECFGPEVGLAEKLYAMYPDETFFIIKFAFGGTDLFSQWLSPSSEGKTGYLYHNFIRYVNKNMKYLTYKGYDVSIEGLCWMQGESDSFSVENATKYEIHLNNFIRDIRKDLSRYASNNGIGFVDATIANNPMFWVYCDQVNQSKQAVSNISDINVLIDTNAEGLDCTQEPEEAPDIPHYDSLSQIKLGNLFAEYVAQFF